MKQRERNKKIIFEPAKSRIKRGECPACGKPKSEWKRRTVWRCCSAKCTANFYRKYYISYGWSDVRLKVLRRDNFVCRECGKEFEETKLIADHIKPIALGGDEWDLNNIQTLCIKCNKIKTAKDMGLIAIERRREKIKTLKLK